MVTYSFIVGYHTWLTESGMKFWKIAAIVALATIPLLLMSKKRVQEKGIQPESGDMNDIFERELSAD